MSGNREGNDKFYAMVCLQPIVHPVTRIFIWKNPASKRLRTAKGLLNQENWLHCH